MTLIRPIPSFILLEKRIQPSLRTHWFWEFKHRNAFLGRVKFNHTIFPNCFSYPIHQTIDWKFGYFAGVHWASFKIQKDNLLPP